jgi:hypothetical protein
MWKLSLMDGDGNVTTRRMRDESRVRSTLQDFRSNASIRAAMLTGADGGMGLWQLNGGKWRMILRVIS